MAKNRPLKILPVNCDVMFHPALSPGFSKPLAELKRLGAEKPYKLLATRNSNKYDPVCYYLYSLEGAIENKHGDNFSKKEKAKPRLSAGLEK